jgi:hypothetical protein
MNSTPEKKTDHNEQSSEALYVFALLGSFFAGVMVTLLAVATLRVDALRRELDKRQAEPTIVVVKGVAHD